MTEKYEFEKKYRDQVLRCSSCGFCRSACPLFGATLRSAFNARGKMLLLKEVMDKKIDLNDELIETLFQCTTCANCSTNCPSGVEVPEIIKQARKDMVDIGSCHPAFKGMHEVLQKHTNIYAEDEPPEIEGVRKESAEYVYFIGCVGAYREDEATQATLELLDRLEVDYTLIDETCCSGVLEDVGYQINTDLARKNTERILDTGAKAIITGCPYCSRTFNNKTQFTALKDNGVSVLHLSQFLKDFDFGVQTDKRVTYHDPCDLGRQIAPNFVELEHHHAEALCCGAGGGVRGAYAKNSIAMARRRLAEAEAVDAEIVLTECNSCIHNLSNAKLRKQKFKIYNMSQFISELIQAN
jgi:Fe-S oxidoreductase